MAPVTNAAELPPYDGGHVAQEAHGRFLARLVRRTTRDALLPGAVPTAAALERHARKFGPEGVRETAVQFGLSVAVARPRRHAKAIGPTLRQRVASYVAAGHGPEVVAEMENLSASRARRLVEEVS